jgi:hypothetical protein
MRSPGIRPTSSTRRAHVRMWLYALRVSLALGCTTPVAAERAAATSGPCPIGDLTQAVEMIPVVRTPDGRTEDVHDGDAIPLIEPPQGGQVVFVGVRARNLDGCGLVIKATLRDPYSSAPVGVEARPVDLTASPGGWGEAAAPSDIASFANVPVCPSAVSTRDLDGQRYVLDIDVTDRAKRTAHTTLDVVPTCAERSLCPRECRGSNAGR